MNPMQESLVYLAVAATGPAITVAAEHPEQLFEASAASILGAVGLALWRLGNTLAGQLKEMAAHRALEAEQWRLQREHWSQD